MIKIEVDSREIDQALRNLSQAVTHMRPAFEDIGRSLVDNIQLHLGDGETPWGDPFEPLKHPRRRQGKRIAGDVPLNDTHQHIYNRITHQADNNSVEVGMNENEVIGRTHQFGATISRAARSQKAYFKVNKNTGASKFAKKSRANFEQWVTIGAHETHIPARPFFPIRNGAVDLPATWEQQILNKIAEHIRKSGK